MPDYFVPDSISPEALQSLMTDAKAPVEAPLLNASKEELVKFIASVTDGAYEQMGTGFAFKLMADYCLFQMFQHHNEGFSLALEHGETEAALAWARDAGQLQAMANTLRQIYMGPQDFQCPLD